MAAPDVARARRAGTAAFVGTTIEWYDFYVYATAASLVFDKVFFPEADRLTAVAASFATFAVGFFARPLGGIVFGHIGDRMGRKSALVITLTMMGTATFLVGCLPGFSSIGTWAPVLLVLLRFIQGIAVGGEWGGAVLMAVEHAPADKRTFYGAFAQAGNPAGALLATGLFALLTLNGNEFVESWGWRIPFFFSALLIVVGFVVRMRVEESPVFAEIAVQADSAASASHAPLMIALRTNWRTILLGACVLPVAIGGYYLTTTFATAYATDPSVGVAEHTVLTALSVAAFVELAVTLGAGWLADKVGRIRVVMAGLAGVALLAAPQFLVFGWGSTFLIFVFIILMRLAMTATYGPIATVLAQMFRPDARYTSISLAYQLSGAVFGGLSPLVSTLLWKWTGSIWPVIGLLIGMCALSAWCLRRVPQYDDVESPEFDGSPAAAPDRANGR
ncbi:MFS transporter [Tsukamurella ocularis]|uniref:MFS transporter n=1 Tax=Tsukamurella ocularis TaxID=1970234 RepID=UPI002166F080|nr:MFS transporter [Tsukamurella ocularis]MCS3781277.1 MFS family permease [Tsukamurella ocularis]MCS3787648.1 MFS family permease [Tsukamurella ocularis]MCS3850943.1 MFS family permease [Tsukamurella ocularis]